MRSGHENEKEGACRPRNPEEGGLVFAKAYMLAPYMCCLFGRLREHCECMFGMVVIVVDEEMNSSLSTVMPYQSELRY